MRAAVAAHCVLRFCVCFNVSCCSKNALPCSDRCCKSVAALCCRNPAWHLPPVPARPGHLSPVGARDPGCDSRGAPLLCLPAQLPQGGWVGWGAGAISWCEDWHLGSSPGWGVGLLACSCAFARLPSCTKQVAGVPLACCICSHWLGLPSPVALTGQDALLELFSAGAGATRPRGASRLVCG